MKLLIKLSTFLVWGVLSSAQGIEQSDDRPLDLPNPLKIEFEMKKAHDEVQNHSLFNEDLKPETTQQSPLQTNYKRGLLPCKYRYGLCRYKDLEKKEDFIPFYPGRSIPYIRTKGQPILSLYAGCPIFTIINPQTNDIFLGQTGAFSIKEFKDYIQEHKSNLTITLSQCFPFDKVYEHDKAPGDITTFFKNFLELGIDPTQITMYRLDNGNTTPCRFREREIALKPFSGCAIHLEKGLIEVLNYRT